MERFLSKSLYNEMDDLIERVDELREDLVDARDAVDYEDFDDLMDTAWSRAQSMQSDIDTLRVDGAELHYNEEDDDDDDEED